MIKAYWDISNKCNLRCAHCAVEKQIKNKVELHSAEYIKIIKNIKDIVSEIDLLGGEPLLNKRIGLILEECEKNSISYNIITNGQFEEKYIKKVLENRNYIGTILVSIEGLEEENDKIRGIGTFKKAVNFINTLMNIKDKSSHKFKIGINATINNYNKNSILEMVNYFIRDIRVDYVQLTPMRNEGKILENQELLINEVDLLEVYMKIAEYILLNKTKEKVVVNFPTQLIPEFLNAKYGTEFQLQNEGCLAVENTIYIDSQGEVKSCRECNNVVVDLKSESLKENFQRFSDFMLKRNNTMVKECECIYRDTCISCLFETNLSKQSICKLVEKHYDIEYLSENICFKLDESSCMYENREMDCYTIFYPILSEKVEYEFIGYKILKEIKEKPLSAKEISKKIEIDDKLIFRFLIQEQTKKHIIRWKG